MASEAGGAALHRGITEACSYTAPPTTMEKASAARAWIRSFKFMVSGWMRLSHQTTFGPRTEGQNSDLERSSNPRADPRSPVETVHGCFAEVGTAVLWSSSLEQVMVDLRPRCRTAWPKFLILLTGGHLRWGLRGTIRITGTSREPYGTERGPVVKRFCLE